MSIGTPLRKIRCAVYTRKSSEEGLEQEFNSLDAQREACEAYVVSQRHEGWVIVPDLYDDGGISGGTLKRPALQRLLREAPHDSVGNYVDPAISSLGPSDPLAEVARRMAAYDILALPVVDEDNHLLGAISIDAAGALLFSTRGTYVGAGSTGADEDVSRFSGSFGPTTSGTAVIALDLSALGISTSEDVDGISFQQ